MTRYGVFLLATLAFAPAAEASKPFKEGASKARGESISKPYSEAKKLIELHPRIHELYERKLPQVTTWQRVKGWGPKIELGLGLGTLPTSAFMTAQGVHNIVMGDGTLWSVVELGFLPVSVDVIRRSYDAIKRQRSDRRTREEKRVGEVIGEALEEIDVFPPALQKQILTHEAVATPKRMSLDRRYIHSLIDSLRALGRDDDEKVAAAIRELSKYLDRYEAFGTSEDTPIKLPEMEASTDDVGIRKGFPVKVNAPVSISHDKLMSILDVITNTPKK